MSKQVMFFAHDPGGAQAISPLISEFANPLVFAKGPALGAMQGAKELPEEALLRYSPAFLITGTSANDFTERLLWKEAGINSIPSMAILDFWSNYGVRFSRYGTENLHLFKYECEYLPKFICVPDDIAKEEMIRDGVPADIIYAFGNPHFEFISSRQQKPDAQKMVAQNEKKIVLFASQPFDDVYREGSELIVLRALISIAREKPDIEICIRKHPKESSEKFSTFLSEQVSLDSTLDVFDSIDSSDIIVSVNSMVLLEALFLGKRIISYQPRCKDGKNDFILTKNDILPFISNDDEFRACFELTLRGKEQYNNSIKCTGIIESIKSFVEAQIDGKVSN